MRNELYARCREALRAVGSESSASECHGLLCGTLCTGDAVDPQRWLHEVLGDAADSSQPMRDGRALLLEMMRETALILSEPDCAFAPLLPDDDEPLAVRARALGQWCSGFLYGLGLAGAGWGSNLSADAREVLKDLCEFARIADDEEESNEREADYAALVEYLRVGVMLVHEEAR